VSINERLASLESTVRAGFDLAERDRKEVKEALLGATCKMDQAIGSISLRLDMHEGILDRHEATLNQTKGGMRVVRWIGSVLLAVWTALEAFFHFGKGK